MILAKIFSQFPITPNMLPRPPPGAGGEQPLACSRRPASRTIGGRDKASETNTKASLLSQTSWKPYFGLRSVHKMHPGDPIEVNGFQWTETVEMDCLLFFQVTSRLTGSRAVRYNRQGKPRKGPFSIKAEKEPVGHSGFHFSSTCTLLCHPPESRALESPESRTLQAP